MHTLNALLTYYVLFFIDIASRSVYIAGITRHPDNRWMSQVARNVIASETGFLLGRRYLILDRVAKYAANFRAVLEREGIHLIRLPPRSPDLNAFAERFVRSTESECLNRMIFFGQASLQHAVWQFMAHYHAERNHQGLENRLLHPGPAAFMPSLPVRQRQRLGGMLNYYHRAAAGAASILFVDTTGARVERGEPPEELPRD